MRRKLPSYEARRSGNFKQQRRLRQEYTVGEVKAALEARKCAPTQIGQTRNTAIRRTSQGALSATLLSILHVIVHCVFCSHRVSIRSSDFCLLSLQSEVPQHTFTQVCCHVRGT
jgi:hypothetical protein